MEKKMSSSEKMRIHGRGQVRSFLLVTSIVLLCFLLPCILFVALRTSVQPLSIVTVQSSTTTSIHIQVVKEEISAPGAGTAARRSLPLALEAEEPETRTDNLPADENTEIENEEKKSNEGLPVSDDQTESGKNSTDIDAEREPEPTVEKLEVNQTETKPDEDAEPQSLPFVYKDMQNQMNSVTAGTKETELPADSTVNQDSDQLPAVNDPEPNFCDFSQDRSDTCSLKGDVRVISQSTTVIVATPPVPDSSRGTPLTWKVRPYARKWELSLMAGIREFSVETSSKQKEVPQCTVNHTAPAIIFSTGGHVGNYFHDFTDLLVPLFATSRQYQGEVHLLVRDYSYGWVSKYRSILNQLSRYEIINLDRDKQVHCFPQVHVGLISNKELSMEPSKTPMGYSLSDFTELLRSVYSLKRKSITGINGRKPRLLIMLRKGSRSFMNKREVVSMGRRLGFKVVAAGPEETRNLTKFAKVVNSCDVMTGVHGAGLTNMLFLPRGAALIQIVPWGELHYGCWHDFGAPAPDMGVRYFEYEIKEKESSLIKKYSRDDPVFRDPLSIHKQGFGAIWSIFLNEQKVKLDVHRFSSVLFEALQAIQVQ